MQIEQSIEGRAVILKLKGRLDLEQVPTLTEAIHKLLDEECKQIILNMLDVTDISSSGIGQILQLSRECQEQNCAFALSELSVVVEYVLDLARLKDVFQIYKTDKEAITKISH